MLKSLANSRMLALGLTCAAAIFALFWILIRAAIVPSPGWHGDVTAPHDRFFMTDRSTGLDLCWKPSPAPANPNATGSVYVRCYLGVDDAFPLKILALDFNAPAPPDPSIPSPPGLALIARALVIGLPNWLVVTLLCLQPLWVVIQRFRKPLRKPPPSSDSPPPPAPPRP